jgi:secretion/DNA translocation related TadE-like protein
MRAGRIGSIKGSENGSAALLLIGGIGALILCFGALAAAVGLAGQFRLQARADSFALAAADTTSGRLPGYPCEKVKSMADVEHVSLVSCEISGLESRVVVSGTAGLMRLTAHAHAGPQKTVSNLTSR